MNSNTLTFCETLEVFIKSLNTKMKIENMSQNTIKAYNTTYKYFIEFCEQYNKNLSFENIKEDDIYAFVSYKNDNLDKQGELAISSINSIVSHLKRLFKHIERNSDELYDFDKVFVDIKLKQSVRVPKGLSNNDVELLIDFFKELLQEPIYSNIRNIILFKLMLFGGLRVSEANTIKLNDFIEQNGLYKINVIGKGDKQRNIFVKTIDFENELNIMKNKLNFDINLPIATTRNGKLMDRHQIRNMANSFYSRAGVKATGLHILRHTAAKRLLANKVSIVVVQSLLGHGSIQTTSIYANPTEDLIRNELQRI